jgi:peptidoglycan/xylan/chitin deacetylase (PgdA/CDA1 family)
LVPQRVARRHTSLDRVLLTFDDGPHPVHTLAVLDRLREFGVEATFFLVGERVPAAPQIVRRIVAEGHRLGNHTLTHGRGPAGRDVAECQRVVIEAAGVTPRLFRPPFGRLSPGLLAAAWRSGLTALTWSLDSNDWRCRSAADADRCAAEVAASARPGDVILFHDDHPHAGRVLDGVLPELAARGLLGPVPAGR